MSKSIKKDIATVETGIILHQVNCQNAMGAGVAKSLYMRWPEVKMQYHKAFEDSTKEELFKSFQYVETGEVLIVNSFTQFNFGMSDLTGICYTDMEALISNLKYICEKFAKQTVYIPKYLGCGLAGGNWDELYAEIKDIENLIICDIEK